MASTRANPKPHSENPENETTGKDQQNLINGFEADLGSSSDSQMSSPTLSAFTVKYHSRTSPYSFEKFNGSEKKRKRTIGSRVSEVEEFWGRYPCLKEAIKFKDSPIPVPDVLLSADKNCLMRLGRAEIDEIEKDCRGVMISELKVLDKKLLVYKNAAKLISIAMKKDRLL